MAVLMIMIALFSMFMMMIIVNFLLNLSIISLSACSLRSLILNE
jgi:hypothetical protein